MGGGEQAKRPPAPPIFSLPTHVVNTSEVAVSFLCFDGRGRRSRWLRV
jgi:hypothetical protein